MQQKVPCVCPADCPHKGDPYLHDYDDLRKFKTKGRRTRECPKSIDDVSIDAMLEGIIDQPIKGSQYFVDLVAKGEIDSFFEELKVIGITKNQLAQLQDEYVHNGGDAKFAQRLTVWVRKHFEEERF